MEIVPLKGLGMVRFGMPPEDVAAILGRPISESRMGGKIELFYNNDINCL